MWAIAEGRNIVCAHTTDSNPVEQAHVTFKQVCWHSFRWLLEFVEDQLFDRWAWQNPYFGQSVMTPYVQIPSVAGSSMLDSLKNPDVVPRKGKPKNVQKSRRFISIGESVRTKKITCSTCGSHQHNRATCTASQTDETVVKKRRCTKKSTCNTIYLQAEFMGMIRVWPPLPASA